MKKILFICHGNICRSPMAEFIMKDIVHKHQKEEEYNIASAAISYEEIGNDIYDRAKDVLIEHNIPFSKHHAKIIQKTDYERYDYLIAMDDENINALQRLFKHDFQHKIYKLTYFVNENGNIIDPWYSRNFCLAFREINRCCAALFHKIENKDI